MEELNNKMIDEIQNTEDKKININVRNPLTPQDFMAIESIRKLKNPFRMIGVEVVMQDLHICRSIAYRLFQRDDFPSINIGKSNQIMLLSYMIWKMQKRT